MAWIRDNYMFDKQAPKDKKHRYALYWDRKTKRYRAVQLTHLYVMDPNREKRLKKGQLMEMRLPGFKLPSGVRDSYYYRTANKKPIDLKNPAVQRLTKRHLPKATADKIRQFAKKPHK